MRKGKIDSAEVVQSRKRSLSGPLRKLLEGVSARSQRLKGIQLARNRGWMLWGEWEKASNRDQQQ